MSSGTDECLHDLFSALCDGAASAEQIDRIEDLFGGATRQCGDSILRYVDLHART